MRKKIEKPGFRGVVGSILVLSFLFGCYNDPLDPTQIGRFEPTPKVNVILNTLGVAEEPSPAYEGAEDPKPEDLVDFQTDYVFGAGDVVQISIFELYQEGQLYTNNYVVTESGRISIPDVGIVQAAGLTESQLEQEIRDILSPNILKNPSVTVSLVNSQKQYFSIVGQGLGTSGRFPLPRYTFRLTDAIALTGSIAEFNLSYIYVSRDVPTEQSDILQTNTAEQSSPADFPAKSAEPESSLQTPDKPEGNLLEIIAPAEIGPKRRGILITSAEMATRHELEALAAPDGLDVPPAEETTQPTPEEQASSVNPNEPIEWVYENGKWVPKVRADAPITKQSPAAAQETQPIPEEPLPAGFGVEGLGKTKTTTRVIRIPVDRLLAGDPRCNVVIRPGDRITVPLDIIGEFWILGNVNAQGPFPLTGRPITLKQAIATAGGLNQIAYPQKVEVIRRLGKNSAGLAQEEIVLVDLKKIAKGTQPDFFIKPYDLINVGTHGSSRYLAVLRNAFRATYGFGLVYDRNFANEDFEDVWTW